MPESGFTAAVLRAVSLNYCLAAMLGRYRTEHCLAEGGTCLVHFAEFAGQWVHIDISRSCAGADRDSLNVTKSHLVRYEAWWLSILGWRNIWSLSFCSTTYAAWPL